MDVDLQAIVDKEVSQLLTKQEAEEQLASLLQRREAMQAETDDKQQQRSQLELQLMRFAEKTHSSVLADPHTASRHQAAAQEGDEHSHVRQGAFTSSPDDSLAPHRLTQHAEAEPNSAACLSLEQLSSEEEEIRRQAAALEDAVDTCQAQMQYLDSSVAACKAVCHSISFACYCKTPCLP